MCLGIPGKIVEIRKDAELATGVVDFGGAKREVCLSYVADDVSLGDYVVVHVGFAISRIDEAEAHKTYAILQAMSELGDLDFIRDNAESLLGEAGLPSAGQRPPESLL